MNFLLPAQNILGVPLSAPNDPEQIQKGAQTNDDGGETDLKKAPFAPQSKKSGKKGGDKSKKEVKVSYGHRWLLTTLKGHSGSVLNLDFSGNGKYLASCADGGTLCWKGGSANHTHPPPHHHHQHNNNNNPCRRAAQTITTPNEIFQTPTRAKKNRKNGSPNGGTRVTSTFSTLNKSPQAAPKYNGIRPPLPVYSALGIEGDELYRRLSSYVLTREVRRRCGYPLECPNVPGRVEIAGLYLREAEKEKGGDPNQRICCRCRSKFTVTEEGGYEAGDTCLYHWGKRKTVEAATVYGCCDQLPDAPGCTRNRFHVSTRPEIGSHEFVRTRSKRPGQRIPGYGIYALDCEMCFTWQGLEVTKVSVVGPDGSTVYDSFVLPESPIVDYNTNFSGITAEDMKNVKTTLTDVHAVLLKLFNTKTILIGHGLENDLKALHLLHETIVDTSVIFPHYYGLPFRRSLKSLMNCYLQKTIQEDGFGHDSSEDARACMELMLWKVLKDQQLGTNQRKNSTAPSGL